MVPIAFPQVRIAPPCGRRPLTRWRPLATQGEGITRFGSPPLSVLITGGAGYIGSHAVLECLDHGEDVVVLDDLSTGFEWAVPEGARLVVGNVADHDLVARLVAEHRVDAVMHFAGSVVGPESIERPLDYFLNNTCRTRALIAAVAEAGVKRFIFSSTAAVYEAPTTLKPIPENAALVPMSPYGQSKLMSETMLREGARAHGMEYVILRYFNVAGADPAGRAGLSTTNATHVMKLACEAATGVRDGFSIYGTDYATPDGTAVRDFIHVSDLASAHHAALRFLRAGGRHFTGNAGYSRGYSVREVAETVRRISGRDFRVRETERREGDIPAIVADASRMMRRLNWRPRHASLDRIVFDALLWEAKLVDIRSAQAAGTARRRVERVPDLQPRLSRASRVDRDVPART